MAPAWEAGALAAMALIQFAVGYWWWKGPHLRGTRYWIGGLFALNGISSARQSLMLLPGIESTVLDVIGALSDKWTNFFLFGFVLLVLARKRNLPSRLLLSAVGFLMAVASPFFLWEGLSSAASFPWAGTVMSSVLTLAIIVGAVALAQEAQTTSEGQDAIWLFALSVIGFRFAELSAWLVGVDLLVDLGQGFPGLASSLLQTATLPALLIGFAIVVRERFRTTPSRDHTLFDISLLLLLTGFLFGFARAISTGRSFAVFFSIGLVRPAGFLVTQWKLADRPFRDTAQWRQLRLGGAALCGAILAVPLASPFGMGTGGTVILGLTLAVFGLGLVRSLRLSRGPAAAPDSNPSLEGDWPVDPEDVALPQDWKEQFTENLAAFRDLPEPVQDGLDRLSRWQRLILALYAAPESDRLPRYERTTPGLHFLTHCPYPSIGAEIARTNERWTKILEELGIDAPSVPSSSETPLIESTTGRAEGLDSPRAKAYHLTPLGKRVGERLVEESGFDTLSAERLRRVIGEGYADHT